MDVFPDSEQPASRWIIAQEGSRETYSLPLAFYRIQQLRLLYVDVWCTRGRNLLRRGPAHARALATRFHPEIPSELVKSFTIGSTVRRAWLRLRQRKLSRTQISLADCEFGRWFAPQICRHLKNQELDPAVDHFFGFNGYSLEILEYLREIKIFSVLDQVDPGLVEEDMCFEEAERWPGWEGTPGRIAPEYWDRVKAEWHAASAVMVNSNWSRKALVQQGVPDKKIMVVPLAVQLPEERKPVPITANGPLKVLWLGSVILRKGIQYLVEAARELERSNIEFLIAGPLGITEQAVRTFPGNIKLLGRITRDQLRRTYQTAHVFVLPTISDGFAVTQLEAMAQGLPVIATPNCGEVVSHGVDGFIVPARDGGALAAAICKLDSDRELLRNMSANSLLTVQKYKLPTNAILMQKLVAQMRCN